MYDNFYTTSCSSHLEPKVMLNVQLESVDTTDNAADWSKVMSPEIKHL